MPSQIGTVLRYLRHAGGERAERCDARLLQQFVMERSEGAFAALLERHGPLVLAVCRRVLGDSPDAEDAFQATFLVLARKAGSIRRHDALAAWLHRVAFNISRTIKAAGVLRRTHERQAVVMSEATTTDEVELRDWQPLLHEEIDRLPEKYRVPVILCYFQGLSHADAAAQLDWPVGSVKGRLARARDLLQARLSRRGLALSSAGLAAALASRLEAAVPPALLGQTLRAAVSFARGAAGAASAHALSLANGALRTMSGTKLVTAIVVLSAFVAAGGLFALGGLGQERNEEKANHPIAEVEPTGLRGGAAAIEGAVKAEEKNAVEKNGARFEILVPQREWSIPVNKPGSETPIKFALRITNKSEKARRFSRLDTIYPDMIGPNGKALHRSGGRNGLKPLKESDFPIVKPGESVTFDIDARLFWQDGKLQFGGSDGFGGIWGFAEEFAPGRYKLRILYLNEEKQRQTGGATPILLKDIWTGEVKTPFVDVVIARSDGFGAEVKGLQAKVTLPKKTFEVGEAISVSYVVRNVSNKDQTIWHSGFWSNHLILVRDANGKDAPLTPYGRDVGRAFSPGGKRKKNAPVDVPRGGEDAAYEEYDLTKLYDLSKPGRYSVQYLYEEKQGGWEGRLPSNEAAFEIVAKKDEGGVQKQDAINTDLKKLQGKWHMVAAEEGGQPIPAANLNPNDYFSFTGNNIYFQSGKRGLDGTFAIDPTKSPKWIDHNVPGVKLVFKGIYEFKGSQLRLYFGGQNGERPTEFKTKPGEKLWIRTLERVKVERPK